ncbi:hypothetical protein D0Y65_018405, partial [Glycine soja]|uniref:Uncharacterized protein n=2 Tax=Glycine subgen. Soja TaxID=1462606 RepID=A0A0R0J604_SOYBN
MLAASFHFPTEAYIFESNEWVPAFYGSIFKNFLSYKLPNINISVHITSSKEHSPNSQWCLFPKPLNDIESFFQPSCTTTKINQTCIVIF